MTGKSAENQATPWHLCLGRPDSTRVIATEAALIKHSETAASHVKTGESPLRAA
jgi:hypothetical protein